MSADNWDTCPRCWRGANDSYGAEYRAVLALYGQVPVEEFDAKREALTPPKEEDFKTFREDYEFFGADTGEIVASYSGHCSACDLSAELRVTKKFWPEES